MSGADAATISMSPIAERDREPQHARPHAIAELLRLDDRAGHAEVAHEVGDADDRRDHRDEAEVRGRQQAREHDRREPAG